jgi:mitochondrial chaperone BCS1
MNLHELVAPLLANPFATGMGATAIIGGLIYRIKDVPMKLWNWFLLATTYSITANSRSDTYRWLDLWLSHQPYSKRTKRLELKEPRGSDRYYGVSADDGIKAKASPYILVPGKGSHFFLWKKCLVYLHRGDEQSTGSSSKRTDNDKTQEFISMRIFGANRRKIPDLVREAYNYSFDSDNTAIRIWAGDWWRQISGKKLRGLDTIVLPHEQLSRIVDDLALFTRSEQWYRQRAIPYRRGYLFSGPPGTGKTSLIMALADHLKRPICVLNLSSFLSDTDLQSAIADAPIDAILVLEDIDCVQTAQSRKGTEVSVEDVELKPDVIMSKTNGKSDSTFVSKAGLLNALDGITTPDGRIFILTTNYPEKLDEALIRPGRCDVHEKFEYFGKDEQIRMAERFFGPNLFEPIDHPVSPAKMQAAFTMYHMDPKKAREMILS